MNLETAQETLKRYFGYTSFRPMQAEIIQAVLNKKDCLVIMPTGGGKSLCYQLPALVMEGMCLVVSPLIALMQDQVDSLKSNNISAAFLNSTQSYSEQLAVMERAREGDLDLLYVSPEKIVSPDFINFLNPVSLSLIAVDEAHCISAWGHDFRPEYTQLSFLKEIFPDVTMIALTATADSATRNDIVSQLSLNSPQRFVASFDRPNLSLKVLPGRNRINFIIDFVKKRPNQSGIIYCLSRKNTEALADKLQKAGINASFYHAGMTAKNRADVQQKFIRDESSIICATIAFGMGIDKSNVRWIIHYNLPKNMEGYYQEIGRAGRDGLSGETILFYSYADVIQLQKFARDSGQSEIQLSKLERIKQYAEAQICRRKILLSYFGEYLQEGCGNCDVCQNPPRQFDGTELAQKALSAIARLDQRGAKVGISLLIDILRGSAKQEIREKGYDQIKTYGAGSDMSNGDWLQTVYQLLHLGLMEIAYDEGNSLKLTDASWSVLRGQQEVGMVRFVSWQEQKEAAAQATKPKTKTEQFQDALFEHLRKYRFALSKEIDVAPYIIFTDATLEDMVKKLPSNEIQMRQVSGVSEAKFQRFGERFIDKILEFVFNEHKKGKEGLKVKGSTYLATLHLIRQNKNAEDIASTRSFSVDSALNHVAYLLEAGHHLDVKFYLNETELDLIKKSVDKLGFQDQIGPYFSYLKGEIGYGKIKLGISFLKKQLADTERQGS